jgi:serine/threonine protein kinase/formylglycine-generating enzyme required for sulfatase activity
MICPSVPELEALVAGGGATGVRIHVERCQACEERLCGLRANAALAAECRGAVRRPPPPDPEAALPSLEGYHFLGRVSQGGQGVVYKAIQQSTRRTVAVKFLHDGAFPSPRQRHRFAREIDLAARLRHPGIVTVHGSGTSADGRLYYVMEFVDGLQLDEYVHRTRCSLRDTVRLFTRVCEAVHHAHQHGVLHRDLKPANVFVDTSDEPRILDFGLARAIAERDEETEDHDHETALTTREGEFVGTFAYASPEQVETDPGRVDARSDVYSLGMILYELVVGHRPYEVSSHNIAASVQAIQHAIPRPPSRLVAGADADLDIIILHALAKDRERRYGSARELASDLDNWVNGRAIEARRDSKLYVLRKSLRRHWIATSALIAISSTSLAAAAVSNHYRAAARVQARRADVSALFARRSAAKAKSQADEVLRLSDVKKLSDLAARAEELWPEVPAKIDAMTRWLDDAAQLTARLADHRATRARLKSRSRRDDREEWWLATLDGLVRGLENLSNPDPKVGLIAEVSRRLAWAKRHAAESVEAHLDAWDQVIADVAEQPAYHGFVLRPQVGLVPIGQDRDSGLFEFSHLRTGAVAERDAGGHLVLAAEMGLVFVLLPGGRFTMGAQKNDPGGPNYDPLATYEEAPHEVEIAPFFLSKYEMTEAQWERFTGSNPSEYRGDLLPVESISWSTSTAVMKKLGLALPTVAQWEYGARGGTATPWWTGSEAKSVSGAGNFADTSFAHISLAERFDAWLDDGAPLIASIGSYRPNPFGLHDTMGNVYEACQDQWPQPRWIVNNLGQDSEVRIPAPPRLLRAMRGGSFRDPVESARSAHPDGTSADDRDEVIGLRPARLIDP